MSGGGKAPSHIAVAETEASGVGEGLALDRNTKVQNVGPEGTVKIDPLKCPLVQFQVVKHIEDLENPKGKFIEVD